MLCHFETTPVESHQVTGTYQEELFFKLKFETLVCVTFKGAYLELNVSLN